MSGLAEVLIVVAQAAATVGVRWYVFGAQAVAAHGIPRATQDLDITVLAEPSKLARLCDELTRHGLVARYPEIAEELLRSGSVIPLKHIGSGFEVDLVVAGTEIERIALDRAEMLNLAGQIVPVCTPTDLVISKAIAGRPLDMSDIRGLLAAGRVDIPEVRGCLRAIEQAIGEDGMLARFDQVAAIGVRQN